uniref:Uncharacterized protein n=1 Tax=Meloidogyne hapla TaxID=6305 RepID=A0A1I8C320_MELHA
MKLSTCFIFLFLIFILIDLNDCGNDKNKGKGKEKRKEKIIEEEHIDPNHAQFLHEQENCHKIQKHNMNILSMGTKIQGVRGSHISNWQQMIDKNTRMISEREQVLAQHLFLQGDIGQGSSGHGTSGQGGSEHGISMDRMPKIPRWETIGSGGKNEENKFDPKDVDQSIIAKLKEMYPHINYTGPEGKEQF